MNYALHRLVLVAAVAVCLSRPVSAEFTHYFPVTVNYHGTETLTDFPVLVRLPPAVTARMRTDGRDIRFYLENSTTELAHECESFKRNETSFYWVKVPSLVPGLKLDIHFADPEFATPSAATDVWTSYIGVWHLNNIVNGTTCVVDSTGRAATGATGGTGPKSVSGKVATACQLISEPSWLINNQGKLTVSNSTGSLSQDGGKLTVSWWMKPNSSGSMPQTTDKSSYLFQMLTMVGTGNYITWDARYQLRNGAAPQFVLRNFTAKQASSAQVVVSDADTKMNLPNWLYCACTIEDDAEHTAATGAIYADTVELARNANLKPLLSVATTGRLIMGCNSGTGDNYRGQMDEVRIRDVVSSPAWLQAERDSANDPEFVSMPEDLIQRISLTRRIVATAAEKTGVWADAVVAGTDAYSAIQGVIDKSAVGDTILVRPGQYVLTNELSFTEGGRRGVTLRSDDGAGNLARKTTVLVGGYPATMNRIVKISTTETIVRGFTLKNGYVDSACGGGVYLDDCGADSGLRDCDIVECTAWYEPFVTSSVNYTKGTGGGAYIYKTGCISNCLFKSNVSFAGAVFMQGSDNSRLHPPQEVPRVTRCDFVWNRQVGKGDPNNCNGSAVATRRACCMDHCTVVSNFCDVTTGVQISTVGGSDGGYLLISNCVFRSNGLGKQKVKLIGTNSASTIRCVGNTFIDEVANPIMTHVDGCDRNTMILCKSKIGPTTVRNCLFVANTNDSGCVDGTCRAENCTFISNKGCIYSNGSAATASRTNRIVNCVFYDNLYDVYAINSGNATPIALFVSNCCMRAWSLDRKSGSNRQFGLVVTNDCNLLYSDEDLEAIQNDLIRFRDLATGDYRLQRLSKLRDAGMRLGWMSGARDRDGLPRCIDRRGRTTDEALPDIGSYECEIHPRGLVVTILRKQDEAQVNGGE